MSVSKADPGNSSPAARGKAIGVNGLYRFLLLSAVGIVLVRVAELLLHLN